MQRCILRRQVWIAKHTGPSHSGRNQPQIAGLLRTDSIVECSRAPFSRHAQTPIGASCSGHRGIRPLVTKPGRSFVSGQCCRSNHVAVFMSTYSSQLAQLGPTVVGKPDGVPHHCVNLKSLSLDRHRRHRCNGLFRSESIRWHFRRPRATHGTL